MSIQTKAELRSVHIVDVAVAITVRTCYVRSNNLIIRGSKHSFAVRFFSFTGLHPTAPTRLGRSPNLAAGSETEVAASLIREMRCF